MATATPTKKYYWYNEGWNDTGSLGTQAGYISTIANGRFIVQPIEVKPSSGYKVTSITFKFGVAAGAGVTSNVDPTIYAQAYNTLANAQAAGSTGKLGNRGSQTVYINESGGMYTITMNGFEIISNTTIYVILYSYSERYGGKLLQYWPKISGNITSLPTASATETANGIVYIYDGSSWRKAIPYIYDGSKWRQAVPYVYNGSAWKVGGI